MSKKHAKRRRAPANKKKTVRTKVRKAASAKAAQKPARAMQATAAKKDAKPKRSSALVAATVVLKASSTPMNCKALIAAMAERKLWTSPKGKTPHATLSAAIQREVAKKGRASRFKKTGRGLYAINEASK